MHHQLCDRLFQQLRLPLQEDPRSPNDLSEWTRGPLQHHLVQPCRRHRRRHLRLYAQLWRRRRLRHRHRRHLKHHLRRPTMGRRRGPQGCLSRHLRYRYQRQYLLGRCHLLPLCAPLFAQQLAAGY